MTYPNNSQYVTWWNLGAHDRQSRVVPDGSNLVSGYTGYDPTADSVLQDLSSNVNVGNPAVDYSPITSALQSGATPFDSDDED